ncbi:MAG: phage tail protein [Halopseudomonas sp.]|uniref:phage tail protein n=1 Tax=Halopseudomonas sp. TaxID=2901191 RepID=UPI0030012288
MSFSANLFGRDSAIFKVGNVLGLGIPGWLDKKFGPPETEGPRLSDLSIQTSTYGADIARVYGTIAIAGNITWLEGGKLKEVVKKNKQGGKGGASSEPDKTYTYYATFHLMLCLGEIQGIRRIWCSDKLIYDAGSDDLETIIASNDAARGWTLYRGTDDQMPDPRYEADVGVESASANRGIAYLAFRDWNLTDYGNSLQGSQFKVEVVEAQHQSSATVLTSIGSSVVSAVAPWVQVSFPTVFGYRLVDIFPPYEAYIGNYWERFTTSGRIDRYGVTPIPSGLPGVRRMVGDADATRVLSTTSAWVDGRYYTGSFSGQLWLVVKGSELYVCSTAGGLQKIDSVHGVEAVRNDHPYRCIAPTHEGIVAYVNPGELHFLDSELSTLYVLDFEYSSTNALAVYISYEDGVVYVAPEEKEGPVLGYDAESGGLVFDSGPTPSTGYSSYSGYPAHIQGGVLTQALIQLSGERSVRAVSIGRAQTTSKSLAEVIQREVELSNLLTVDDIDVSMIDRDVRGYMVTGGTIRSSLEPLATAYQFDVIQSGYKLKFVPRGGASVLTVPYADLGANSGDSPDEIFSQSREMDPQLPAKTTVSYLDPNREYEISEQYAARINTEAVNEVDVELALVMEADEGAGIAEILQNLAWLWRTDGATSLPPPYQGLEPTDVITLNSKSAVHEVFVSEVDYTQDGRVEIKFKPNAAAVFIPNASGGEGNVPPGTIGLPGPSLFLPLDIPLVDEISQNTPGFVGAMTGYTEGWPGATAFRSADSGQTWTDIQGYSGKASIGSATNTLGVSEGYLIDSRTLNVLMISGELESITYDQLLTGYNYAAYGVDGRWEIVRFQNAALQADGSYTLSGFVRGDKGTEWATGLHQSGDWFVLLDDPDNAFISMATANIGIEQLYRGITQRASIDTGTDVEFGYDGVNLEPLSPVYARATRDGSGNLSATFVRRSRLGSTWWGNGVEAPIGEATQSYQIDVIKMGAVIRTIESSTPAFSYSAADQVTDFGSAQSSILFRIYQVSDLVGRGFVREVTL